MEAFSFYDTTVLSLGALFFGIILLIKGGGWAIDAAVFVASRFGISPMVIGFTIIAFGTSLPELIVSLFANMQGSPGIALGNVLGSNIANILLILGTVSLLTAITVKMDKMLVRDMSFMIFATLFLLMALSFGDITRVMGFAMVSILMLYIFWQYQTTKDDVFDTEMLDKNVTFKSDYTAYLTLVVGLISIAIGAEFLVKGARVCASLVGVPESIIALSLIALGTSLPELATSIIAVRKGRSDMVIGNIIGSNVFNLLMIIGATALATPILQGEYAPQILNFDIWVTLFVTLCFALILFIFKGIGRVAGLLFLLSYGAYNIYIYMINMIS